MADSAYAATIRDIRARLQLLEASPSDSSRVLGTRHTQLDFDLASLTPAVPPVVRVAVHMRRGDLSSKGAAAPSRDARWNDGGQANYYAAIMRSVRAVIVGAFLDVLAHDRDKPFDVDAMLAALRCCSLSLEELCRAVSMAT